MASLASHKSAKTTKMLLLGDSGTGKTGSLASLAKAGYSLRIIDCDNGLDILANLLRDDPKAMARVSYVTCTDKYKKLGNKLAVTRPIAWNEAMSLLDNWKTETEDFGSIYTWGEKDVLVIDSLTLLSQAALAQVLALQGRPQGPAQIQDWGAAMASIESLCGLLYSDSVLCNVLVTSHITYIGDDRHLQGYPSTLGQKLPPKIGRYFNTMLRTYIRGSGVGAKYKIATRVQGNIVLKTSSTTIPADLPLETGLATYFGLVQADNDKGE